jgi:prevent-host-death family protein
MWSHKGPHDSPVQAHRKSVGVRELKTHAARILRPQRLKHKRGSKRREPRSRQAVKKVALARVKDDLSKYLRLAVETEIVITRHGRPAAVLIGFASEDDWFDYRLEHHPEFLRRIEDARTALRKGLGVALEDAV